MIPGYKSWVMNPSTARGLLQAERQRLEELLLADSAQGEAS